MNTCSIIALAFVIAGRKMAAIGYVAISGLYQIILIASGNYHAPLSLVPIVMMVFISLNIDSLR